MKRPLGIPFGFTNQTDAKGGLTRFLALSKMRSGIDIIRDISNRNKSHLLDYHMKRVPFLEPGQYVFRLVAGHADCETDSETILRVRRQEDFSEGPNI